MKTQQLYSLTLIVVALWGCNNPQGSQHENTTVSGEILVGVDESLAPLVVAQTEAFHATYPDAIVRIQTYSEHLAIENFLADSVQTIVVTRQLNAEEQALLNKQKYFSKHTKIAYDAVVMIASPEHPLSTLDSVQLQAIFSGKDSQYPLIFDSETSGTLRMIMDLYPSPDSIASYFKAAENTPEVVAYLTENKNAIGLVGRSWISEKHDSITANFLNEVKILSLQGLDGAYYQPYQAYIAQKSYPLIREVFIISREAYTGLGSGFTAYAAGDKGQRVVLKSGLVPATMPIRLVQFSEKNNSKL
ncbi:substrate-binding domain-containing protein [Marivirga sp.]|uniref:PstS family phosphate ABC transporter substrate-binding protein n=1 Tax=Marivirga sp. TaxID=2018662 RepID=UPI002D7ECBB6|nr:substrate-binding domain-containing protein [Marivirga sp.]HET8860890.1 substrate-binding domain-containing protein [Marivirga sp.]